MTSTTEITATTTNATAATQGTNSTPTKATSTRKASQKKAAPKAKGARKTGKPATKKASKAATKKAKTEASVPREFSKKAIVLDLLRRKDGATMGEIAKATEWQRHSIRGFISGTVSKRMGLKVESSKNDAGERVYHITGK